MSRYDIWRNVIVTAVNQHGLRAGESQFNMCGVDMNVFANEIHGGAELRVDVSGDGIKAVGWFELERGTYLQSAPGFKLYCANRLFDTLRAVKVEPDGYEIKELSRVY